MHHTNAYSFLHPVVTQIKLNTSWRVAEVQLPIVGRMIKVAKYKLQLNTAQSHTLLI